MGHLVLRAGLASLLSFLVTYYLVPLLCAIARKFNVVDIPDGVIKKHKVATPYLGGAAVYIGFISSLALLLPFENRIVFLLVGSTLLFFVGLVDDLVVLKPYQKLAGQIIATLCFLKSGVCLKEHLFCNYWNIPISFLWVLTIINAFNLVDVMDGLATLLAIWVSAAFMVIALYFGHIGVVLLLSALIGALAAFFCFNKPPAKIYLGDAGSLFIGGLIAAVPFLFNWGTYNWYGYVTPVVILAIPLLEVTSLVVIRIYKGIPFYCPSDDHFSLYLQSNGWSKSSILMLMTLFSVILLISSSLFVSNFIPFVKLAILGIFFLVVWIKLIFRPSLRPLK